MSDNKYTNNQLSDMAKRVKEARTNDVQLYLMFIMHLQMITGLAQKTIEEKIEEYYNYTYGK